ncbi:MAG: hypothetical protein HY660_13410 [Armatimonadetes bacterium]|nr:hypothetical protein [Armatimonadota bacterium]
MASLKARFGDRLTFHYHEVNAADSEAAVRDFDITSHPQVFLIDPRGRLVKSFAGVVPEGTLTAEVTRLLR